MSSVFRHWVSHCYGYVKFLFNDTFLHIGNNSEQRSNIPVGRHIHIRIGICILFYIAIILIDFTISNTIGWTY